jgi:hypothetical protein
MHSWSGWNVWQCHMTIIPVNRGEPLSVPRDRDIFCQTNLLAVVFFFSWAIKVEYYYPLNEYTFSPDVSWPCKSCETGMYAPQICRRCCVGSELTTKFISQKWCLASFCATAGFSVPSCAGFWRNRKGSDRNVSVSGLCKSCETGMYAPQICRRCYVWNGFATKLCFEKMVFSVFLCHSGVLSAIVNRPFRFLQRFLVLFIKIINGTAITVLLLIFRFCFFVDNIHKLQTLWYGSTLPPQP